MFFGPGKRWLLSKKKESKSKVSIFISNDDKKNISLGYIKKGKPYQIPQISIKLKEGYTECNILIDFSSKNVNEDREDLLKKLENIDSEKFIRVKHIKDNSINHMEFILGYFENKWYMITNGGSVEFEYVKENINKIINEYKNINTKNNEIRKSKQITAMINLSINAYDFYRFCAKIAFNYLAYIDGQDFVLNKRFDKIREYILGKSKITNIHMLEKFELPIKLPEESHYLVMARVEKSLFAIVALYSNSSVAAIELCEEYDENFIKEDALGYICDWKNRKEYKIIDYVDKFCDGRTDINGALVSEISTKKL